MAPWNSPGQYPVSSADKYNSTVIILGMNGVSLMLGLGTRLRHVLDLLDGDVAQVYVDLVERRLKAAQQDYEARHGNPKR